MSSIARRIERRIRAKINDANPDNRRFRITERVKGLTHRQAQRGMKKGPNNE
jgi:hypothetical protein